MLNLKVFGFAVVVRIGVVDIAVDIAVAAENCAAFQPLNSLENYCCNVVVVVAVGTAVGTVAVADVADVAEVDAVVVDNMVAVVAADNGTANENLNSFVVKSVVGASQPIAAADHGHDQSQQLNLFT